MKSVPREPVLSSRHARQIRDSVESKTNSSPLASSWRRCLALHDLDPDRPRPHRRHDAAGIEVLRDRSATMIEVATSHLDQVSRLLGDGGDFIVLLAERDGVILEVRTSGSRYDGADAWVGIDFSEDREGTNAIGTSLVEKRPLTIVAGEHFYTRNTTVTCSSAPIFDPVVGIAGVIDITRPASEAHPVLDRTILALAIDTARRIELALFARAFPEARKLMAGRHGCNGGAVLAVDADDMVVGATHAARQLLGLSSETMSAPFPAEDIWPTPGGAPNRTLEAVERAAIERALAKHTQNISAAARSLGISRGTLHRKMAAWRE